MVNKMVNQRYIEAIIKVYSLYITYGSSLVPAQSECWMYPNIYNLDTFYIFLQDF